MAREIDRTYNPVEYRNIHVPGGGDAGLLRPVVLSFTGDLDAARRLSYMGVSALHQMRAENVNGLPVYDKRIHLTDGTGALIHCSTRFGRESIGIFVPIIPRGGKRRRPFEESSRWPSVAITFKDHGGWWVMYSLGWDTPFVPIFEPEPDEKGEDIYLPFGESDIGSGKYTIIGLEQVGVHTCSRETEYEDLDGTAESYNSTFTQTGTTPPGTYESWTHWWRNKAKNYNLKAADSTLIYGPQSAIIDADYLGHSASEWYFEGGVWGLRNNVTTETLSIEDNGYDLNIFPSSRTNATIVEDIDPGANNLSAVVAQGDSYTNANFAFFYTDQGYSFDYSFTGSGSNPDDVAHLLRIRNTFMSLVGAGGGDVLDASMPTSRNFYLRVEDQVHLLKSVNDTILLGDIYPKLYVWFCNIYDYHGTPLYVFAFSVALTGSGATPDISTFQFGYVFRGEMGLSEEFECWSDTPADADTYYASPLDSKARFDLYSNLTAIGVEIVRETSGEE